MKKSELAKIFKAIWSNGNIHDSDHGIETLISVVDFYFKPEWQEETPETRTPCCPVCKSDNLVYSKTPSPTDITQCNICTWEGPFSWTTKEQT